MKQKILWSICAMFLCFGTGCPAASFDDLWKQVEKYERQDLPKSAYKVVGQIAAKADKEQQKGQRMAALLYGCKLRQDIVPDSFYSDIMKLERLKRQTADEVQRAVLASVLGELYEDNANRNRNYSDRTDAHPDSIREWSWEQFMKVSSENYLLSMARPDLLAAAKAADYMPFVEKGKDAGYFGGDLLNVIGRRAVQARANKGEGSYALDTVYARMLAVYRARGNREAELLVSVDSVAFALERGDVELAGQTGGLSPEETERVVLQSPAYKAYERLLSCFGDLPLSAEVYLGMLDLEVTPGTKVAWAEEGYAKYKAYPRAKELLNRKRQLEAPFVFLRFPAEVYPGVPNEYVVEHRNVAGMSLSWYQLPDGFPKAEARRAEYRKDEAAYARKYGVLRKTDRLNWQAQPAFLQVEDTFRLACPGVGYFVVVGKADGVASSDGKMVASFRASRFEVVAGDLPDSTSLCTVVDAQTGAPVPSATVEWCAAKDVVYSTQTDAEGKARWNFADYRKKHADRYSLSIKVRKGDDRYKYEHSCTFRQPYRTDDGTHGEERLYTDRAVYRPGQTVYIGGLCWDRKNDREQAAGGRKVVLALRDPNGKTVAEQTVESDEWGTFSATFALPVKGLSGRYAVRTGNNSVGFTVEEYKRPTFEVRLDEITARYQAGDTLCLAGTAMGYNGVPLRLARVTAVSVVGSWFYRVDRGGEEIPIDTVYTGEDGRFTLRVPVREAGRRGPRYGARQFVDVSVMGASGETQTAKTSFPLNEESLRLTLEVGTYWTKDSLPALKAVVQTNAGAEFKGRVEVTGEIYRMQDGKQVEKVLSGFAFPANKPVRLSELSALPSGSYEMQLRAVTESDTLEYAHPFVLFSLSDRHPGGGEKFFYYCIDDTVSAGRPARLMVGSGADSVSLFYMLFCEDRILAEKVFHFSDSILHFEYPEVPAGADGLQAIFYFVKDGQYYGQSQHLIRKQPDRRLRLSWTSFRDRLLPGSEETWNLRITRPDGLPAPAQLMATLYDASLDGIQPHAWNFSHYVPLSLPRVDINKFWLYGGDNMSYHASVRRESVKPLRFDYFNPMMMAWGGLRTVEEVLMIADNSLAVGAAPRNGRIAGMEVAVGKQKAAPAAGAPEYMALKSPSEEEQALVEGAAKAEVDKAPGVAVRENLNETAFFYPRLMADTSGVVTLRFTLPESLTTWKFMALAHTKDMMAGLLTDEVVAAKEVMAQLSLPRFVRMGDRATLSATLFNLTEKTLEGKATMEVFDPATGKSLWKETVKVEMEAKSDTVVSFAYTPSGTVSLPACRIIFEAGEHTDGEQRYLPVLEDKEWLTQTQPFVVSHEGDTVIRLGGLFQDNHPEAEHRRLTVEYTANPLWYAVQALPSVLEPRTDDVLSLGAAYYASTLSSTLAVRYPQVKTAVEFWQREAGEELKSPLSGGEDLTGIVLEETPWVADAEMETQRLTALQQLFDANRQVDLRRRFAEALGKLQRGDGSFGWFEGMSGNAWLTGRVARLLLRSGAGVKTDSLLTQYVDVKKMMVYLMGKAHEEIITDKESLREHKIHAYGGSYWLDYLYLASLSDVTWFDASVRKDLGYMQSRILDCVEQREADGKRRMAGDSDRLSLTETAQAVIVLRYMGKADAAAGLVRSLREHLVDGAEGLHLEYPSNGFVGSDRKIAVHTLLMEALSAPGNTDEKEQEGLCRWLLSQKRLQAWGTTTSSMDAVYALMQGQKRDLVLRSNDVVRLESPKGEELAVLKSSESKLAGLGTVTATVEGRELSKGAGLLKVEKAEGRPSAWGAVYAQYRLPLSEVGSSASGLRIRQEVDNEHPRVGDRVTLRYMLTSDRDYEYVRLKAGRAACLEPMESRSGYEYRNGLGYYKEVKDASTNYFFERLPKGTYVIEAECYVERAGRYALGAVKLNGVYAPEFSAYGAGTVLEVSE